MLPPHFDTQWPGTALVVQNVLLFVRYDTSILCPICTPLHSCCLTTATCSHILLLLHALSPAISPCALPLPAPFSIPGRYAPAIRPCSLLPPAPPSCHLPHYHAVLMCVTVHSRLYTPNRAMTMNTARFNGKYIRWT